MDINILGKRIKYFRKKKDMSLEDLAVMLNISDDYLREIEEGRNTPGLDVFIDITTALDVVPEQLLSEQEDNNLYDFGFIQETPVRSRYFVNYFAALMLSPEIQLIAKRETLGRRIFLARKKIGMSRKDLSEISKFSSSHVGNIETGTASTTLNGLCKLLSVLDATISDVLQDQCPNACISELNSTLIQAKKILPPKRYEIYINIIKELANFFD